MLMVPVHEVHQNLFINMDEELGCSMFSSGEYLHHPGCRQHWQQQAMRSVHKEKPVNFQTGAKYPAVQCSLNVHVMRKELQAMHEAAKEAWYGKAYSRELHSLRQLDSP